MQRSCKRGVLQGVHPSPDVRSEGSSRLNQSFWLSERVASEEPQAGRVRARGATTEDVQASPTA